MAMRKMYRVAARVALWVIAALFVLTALFAVLSPMASAAETGFRWTHYGADPFAKTRSEAMAVRERVFRESFGFSDSCVKAAMQATVSTGRVGHLNVGDQLSVMVSARFVAHRPTIVDFPPVRKGIDYAATIEIWEFNCDGQQQKVGLPEICNNWALYFPTPIIAEQCSTVAYRVKPGDEVRFAVLAHKRLSASACWQLCDGDVCSAPPSPCDSCDWIGPKSVIPAGFEPLHTGLYLAQQAQQTLRFPLDVMSEYVALCVTRDKLGQSNAAVVLPPTWGESRTVTIPANGFPLWGSEHVGREIVPAAR